MSDEPLLGSLVGIILDPEWVLARLTPVGRANALRKELALRLLLVLAVAEHGSGASSLAAFMTSGQLFVYAVVTAVSVPCVATLADEFGWRSALAVTGATLGVALVAGALGVALVAGARRPPRRSRLIATRRRLTPSGGPSSRRQVQSDAITEPLRLPA